MRLAIFGVAASAALALGQVSYQDPSGQLSLRFGAFSYVLGAKGVTTWTLTGKASQVYAANRNQGLELWAGRAVIRTVQEKAGLVIRDGTLTGGVRAVKSGSAGRAEMTGSSAKYAASGSSARVEVSGSVRLTNSDRGQSLVATGRGLVANLSLARSARPLRSATLDGPVHVDVQQAASGGGKASRMSVDAGRMTLDYASRPARLTLVGNVRIHALQNGGMLQGSLPRVILYLNDRGEVERMEGGG